MDVRTNVLCNKSILYLKKVVRLLLLSQCLSTMWCVSACWGSFHRFKRGGHFLFPKLTCSQSVIGEFGPYRCRNVQFISSSWASRRLDLKLREASLIEEMLQWPVSYMIHSGINTDHCFMIFFRGVNQEEVEDILETWLKVRSWVIFQWGVSEERVE